MTLHNFYIVDYSVYYLKDCFIWKCKDCGYRLASSFQYINDLNDVYSDLCCEDYIIEQIIK